ncbi:glycosyl hydrolase [Nocardioides ferulae]|uniref:glycosyl hydrolase n=1 Tax=Nocardioides ferulae TaxID=2340821 RepID=UPI0013DE5C26|nr:glycosyl hydrolase [Nocardioides ferulae]
MQRQSLRPLRYAAALAVGAATLALAPVAPAVPVTPAPPGSVDGAVDDCTPRPALVDPDATPEARCLAARLDRWRAKRRMAVGQQLNVSNGDPTAPLDELGDRPVPVVGFDLEELDQAANHEYPSDDAVLAELLTLAAPRAAGGEGAVLVATWHARNPHTGAENSFADRSWHDLGALLRDTTEAAAFWAGYDTMLGYLARLQSGEDGRYSPAAVVFRPLHEANGGWFWWGHPKRDVYRELWARMQDRASDAGVHNIVWAYSANVVNDQTVRKPVSLLPAGRVDLAGLDSYDFEDGDRSVRRDRLPLAGWGELAGKVKRMALTEVGPYDSTTGRWDPAVVTRTLRARKIRPVWAMFWFDDLAGNDPRHLRQLSSLRGGRAWLDEQCASGTCRLR